MSDLYIGKFWKSDWSETEKIVLHVYAFAAPYIKFFFEMSKVKWPKKAHMSFPLQDHARIGRCIYIGLPSPHDAEVLNGIIEHATLKPRSRQGFSTSFSRIFSRIDKNFL